MLSILSSGLFFNRNDLASSFDHGKFSIEVQKFEGFQAL